MEFSEIDKKLNLTEFKSLIDSDERLPRNIGNYRIFMKALVPP